MLQQEAIILPPSQILSKKRKKKPLPFAYVWLAIGEYNIIHSLTQCLEFGGKKGPFLAFIYLSYFYLTRLFFLTRSSKDEHV